MNHLSRISDYLDKHVWLLFVFSFILVPNFALLGVEISEDWRLFITNLLNIDLMSIFTLIGIILGVITGLTIGKVYTLGNVNLSMSLAVASAIVMFVIGWLCFDLTSSFFVARVLLLTFFLVFFTKSLLIFTGLFKRNLSW